MRVFGQINDSHHEVQELTALRCQYIMCLTVSYMFVLSVLCWSRGKGKQNAVCTVSALCILLVVLCCSRGKGKQNAVCTVNVIWDGAFGFEVLTKPTMPAFLHCQCAVHSAGSPMPGL
jgi:hypothetical protein